jgi:hypothetical protein
MAAYNDFGVSQLPPTYLPEEEVQGETKRLLRRSLSQGGTLSNTVQPGQGTMLPNALGTMRDRAAGMYDRATQLMSQPLDYSGIQAFAKQRGQEGEQAMLNALAAQYAGEQFQPLAQQFMKTAAGSKEPIKMGGGLVTNTGQFIKDPEAAQDKEVALLLNQAKAYEQMAQTAETARERIEAQRKHDQTMEQLRLMGLGIQQQGVDLRREMAANKTEDHSKTWRAEDTLRKDFDTLTKDLREELNATSKITQIVSATPPGKKPDAITQQSLVILLNKFLDPGSVVREGEFDRVVKAQGLEGRARNLADRIIKGEPLDINTIKQINGLAQMYSQAASAKIQGIANNYNDIASRRKLDVNSVISDPRFRGGQAPGGVIDFNSLPVK